MVHPQVYAGVPAAPRQPPPSLARICTEIRRVYGELLQIARLQGCHAARATDRAWPRWEGAIGCAATTAATLRHSRQGSLRRGRPRLARPRLGLVGTPTG